MRFDKNGFTLIEMMVVLVLVAMLLVGVSTLLLSNLRGGGKATILANLRDEGDAAILTMERELRFGESPSPCLGDAENLLQFKDQTNKDVVYETGMVNGKNVIMKTYDLGTPISLFGGEAKLTDTSDNIFFCKPGNNSFEAAKITISFELQSNDDSDIKQTFQTTVSMRNKEE